MLTIEGFHTAAPLPVKLTEQVTTIGVAVSLHHASPPHRGASGEGGAKRTGPQNKGQSSSVQDTSYNFRTKCPVPTHTLSSSFTVL
jgi:hypothetical protein